VSCGIRRGLWGSGFMREVVLGIADFRPFGRVFYATV
jgi:hypothetical protein